MKLALVNLFHPSVAFHRWEVQTKWLVSIWNVTLSWNHRCRLFLCLDYGAGVLKHKCICPNGYYGSRCHKNVDYCSHNPCKNEGACYTKVHGYTCKCKIGYSGENCQINLDECQPNPCLNNGTCVDGLASFQCHCRDGYKGTSFVCLYFTFTCPKLTIETVEQGVKYFQSWQ